MKLKYVILSVTAILNSSTEASHLRQFHGLRAPVSLAKQEKTSLGSVETNKRHLLRQSRNGIFNIDGEGGGSQQEKTEDERDASHGLRASPSLIKETGSFNSQQEERKRLRQHEKITNNYIFIESRKNTKSAKSDGKASKTKGSKGSTSSALTVPECSGNDRVPCGNEDGYLVCAMVENETSTTVCSDDPRLASHNKNEKDYCGQCSATDLSLIDIAFHPDSGDPLIFGITSKDGSHLAIYGDKDESGNLLQVKSVTNYDSISGNITVTEYDELFRPSRIVLPSGDTTYLTWNSSTRVTMEFLSADGTNQIIGTADLPVASNAIGFNITRRMKSSPRHDLSNAIVEEGGPRKLQQTSSLFGKYRISNKRCGAFADDDSILNRFLDTELYSADGDREGTLDPFGPIYPMYPFQRTGEGQYEARFPVIVHDWNKPFLKELCLGTFETLSDLCDGFPDPQVFTSACASIFVLTLNPYTAAAAVICDALAFAGWAFCMSDSAWGILEGTGDILCEKIAISDPIEAEEARLCTKKYGKYPECIDQKKTAVAPDFEVHQPIDNTQLDPVLFWVKANPKYPSPWQDIIVTARFGCVSNYVKIVASGSDYSQVESTCDNIDGSNDICILIIPGGAAGTIYHIQVFYNDGFLGTVLGTETFWRNLWVTADVRPYGIGDDCSLDSECKSNVCHPITHVCVHPFGKTKVYILQPTCRSSSATKVCADFTVQKELSDVSYEQCWENGSDESCPKFKLVIPISEIPKYVAITSASGYFKDDGWRMIDGYGEVIKLWQHSSCISNQHDACGNEMAIKGARLFRSVDIAKQYSIKNKYKVPLGIDWENILYEVGHDCSKPEQCDSYNCVNTLCVEADVILLIEPAPWSDLEEARPDEKYAFDLTAENVPRDINKVTFKWKRYSDVVVPQEEDAQVHDSYWGHSSVLMAVSYLNAGFYELEASVYDDTALLATNSYSVTILEPLLTIVTPDGLENALVGVKYSFKFIADRIPSYVGNVDFAWSFTGNVNAMDSAGFYDAENGRVIYGDGLDHTYTSPGTFTFVAQVRVGSTAEILAEKSIEIAVHGPSLKIDSPALENAEVGVGYDFHFTAERLPSTTSTIIFAWTFNDNLNNMELSPPYNVVDGKAAMYDLDHRFTSEGTYTLVAEVRDGSTSEIIATHSVDIYLGPSLIIWPLAKNVVMGVEYTFDFHARGILLTASDHVTFAWSFTGDEDNRYIAFPYYIENGRASMYGVDHIFAFEGTHTLKAEVRVGSTEEVIANHSMDFIVLSPPSLTVEPADPSLILAGGTPNTPYKFTLLAENVPAGNDELLFWWEPGFGERSSVRIAVINGIARHTFNLVYPYTGSFLLSATIMDGNVEHELATTSIIVEISNTNTINPIVWMDKLFPINTALPNAFGDGVSLFEDTALIGAPGDDNSRGSAFVYIRNEDGTWKLQQKLLPDKGLFRFSRFGKSVALFGNYALIGAHGSRYAFMFGYNGTHWNQDAKLESPESVLYFGRSVALYEDTALIAASGSAHIFVRTETSSGFEWVDNAQPLIPKDGERGFGTKVALSDSTALVSGLSGTRNSVWFFKCEDSVCEEHQKMKKSGSFGGSISLYHNVALIGAPYGQNDNGVRTGCAFIFTPSSDGTWMEAAKLLPNYEYGSVYSQKFGWSVSLGEEIALIGARNSDIYGDLSGSAFVFEKGEAWTSTTWNDYRQRKIIPDDGGERYYFGGSVSLSGDVALIGSPGNSSAYVYDVGRCCPDNGPLPEWDNGKKEVPYQVEERDKFGHSVAVFDDTFVVSAPYTGRVDVGAVYVYSKIGNNLSTPYQIPFEENAYLSHGLSVAIYRDTIVIGSPNHKEVGLGSIGAVHVYERDGSDWIPRPKPLLATDDPNPNDVRKHGDKFGFSVGIYGDYIVVGAPEKDVDGIGSKGLSIGSIYIYEKVEGDWIWEQTIVPTVCLACQQKFGYNVAIHDGTIVVGAPYYDVEATAETTRISNNGAAYIYTKEGASGWGHRKKLVADDASFNDNFGWNVGVYEGTVIVGAPNKGAAYVYNKLGDSNWELGKKFVPDDGSYIGKSVGIHSDTFVLGHMCTRRTQAMLGGSIKSLNPLMEKASIILVIALVSLRIR